MKGPAPVIAPALTTNQMNDAPAGLLSSRAGSPVHWQHWEPGILPMSADARRLIFAFVGSAQYPGCVEMLDAIDRDPSLVARLNDEFVPVLVDIDLSRECGLAAGILSNELRQPVSFPFILVLSPDGNEVTWRPLHYRENGNMSEIFEGATDVISRMWAEDPDYVIRNSTTDHANRENRLAGPDPVPATAAERDEFLAQAARQLSSLYDADISSLSGTGGLLPLGILQCLASAATDPAMPPSVAARCKEAVRDFSRTLLGSAMVDPLDGGIFASRRGKLWNLTTPHRNCMTQARAARALASLHSATKNPLPLEVALGAVRFAESEYAAQDGLFATLRQPVAADANALLWSREQIESVLNPQEAAMWIERCGVTELGNLSDAGGEFFRLNSLGFRTTLGQAADAAKVAPADAAAVFESGRAKLLEARQQRIPRAPAATRASAAPSFRMISAYAALFSATGDPVWRDKALAVAKRAREVFSAGDLLVEQSPAVPAAICDARAFTYALAIQAALDLAEITLDETWRIWAGDLATTLAENFVNEDGRLLEARPESTPLTLPIEDRVMLFDDTTAGLMRMNLARLDALGQSPPPLIAAWMKSLPPIRNYPVVLTDSILATSFDRSRMILEVPSTASTVWRDTAAKLPLDRIARRIGPASEATLYRPDGSTIVVEDPAELAKVLSEIAP